MGARRTPIIQAQTVLWVGFSIVYDCSMVRAVSELPLGLELILGQIDERYRLDDLGRLVVDRSGGLPPRFIFARSAEGCLWRFRFDLSEKLIGGLAKLAARERGWPDSWEGMPPQPDRLVMMARLLGEPFGPVEAIREPILLRGELHGELWTFD
jgi:hypothetical protein